MDEIPLTFDVPSNKTVSVKGSRSITIKTTGHEKTHYTVVLACCADGTKLPPFLIFNRKYSNIEDSSTEDDALFKEGDTSDDGNSRDDNLLIFYDDDNEKDTSGNIQSILKELNHAYRDMFPKIRLKVLHADLKTLFPKHILHFTVMLSTKLRISKSCFNSHASGLQYTRALSVALLLSSRSNPLMVG
ncbi:hypothetical protein J437_LFUL015380 [Ladona fulva]|uniref:Uncharacterized protein n=1 Tax=Ladona fulva TaxID=123851 RepID=A0A8K0P9P4_LADFU|nr:hypothetical protein J437_LFUL015380 [Ladona fulva]